MQAVLLLDARHVIAANAFTELVAWRLGARLPGSRHEYKCRLALALDRHRVLRYDNESGKGDHRHLGGKEHPYAFSTPQRLRDDFWSAVDRRRF